MIFNALLSILNPVVIRVIDININNTKIEIDMVFVIFIPPYSFIYLYSLLFSFCYPIIFLAILYVSYFCFHTFAFKIRLFNLAAIFSMMGSGTPIC